MPNYVTHNVTIVGSADNVQEVVDFVRSDYGEFDFNKIIPMPETFRKYDTTNHPDGAGLVVGQKVGWYDDSPIVTEELIREYKEATREQREKYGVVGWYDWSLRNWGTKWNAIEPQYWGDGMFTFDTAWSDVVSILKRLAKMFPEVEINFVYADEDSGYNTGEGWLRGGEGSIYYPNGGSDDAYELYFRTHEWARDTMHKNEDGEWVWNED